MKKLLYIIPIALSMGYGSIQADPNPQPPVEEVTGKKTATEEDQTTQEPAVYKPGIFREFIGHPEDTEVLGPNTGHVYMWTFRDARTGILTHANIDVYQKGELGEHFILEDSDLDFEFDRIVISPVGPGFSPSTLIQMYKERAERRIIDRDDPEFQEYYEKTRRYIELLENQEYERTDPPRSSTGCPRVFLCNGKSYGERNMPFFGTTEIHIHKSEETGETEEVIVNMIFEGKHFRIINTDQEPGFDTVILFPPLGNPEGRPRTIPREDPEFQDCFEEARKMIEMLEKPRYEKSLERIRRVISEALEEGGVLHPSYLEPEVWGD